MQEIKAYKTRDGKIFDHKPKAEDHEIELELKDFLLVAKTVEEFEMRNEFIADPIGFIIKNKHVLLSILKGERIEEGYPTQDARLTVNDAPKEVHQV